MKKLFLREIKKIILQKLEKSIFFF